jgi:5-methylthioribose kinase
MNKGCGGEGLYDAIRCAGCKELRDALAERDADLKKIAIVNLRLSTEKKALQEQNVLLVKENEQLEGVNRELLSKINSPRVQVQSIR